MKNRQTSIGRAAVHRLGHILGAGVLAYLLGFSTSVTAGHEQTGVAIMPVDGASSEKSQTYSSPLELEPSERQVKELIDSNLQTQQRSRLRAYEVAGITALTGGMMLVGALAGGPAVALAAGIGTLTIYTVFD